MRTCRTDALFLLEMLIVTTANDFEFLFGTFLLVFGKCALSVKTQKMSDMFDFFLRRIPVALP